MDNKKYVVLYYISFVLTLAFAIFSSLKYSEIVSINSDTSWISNLSENILGIINLVLVIIFTAMLIRKKKIEKETVLFPVIYLCYFLIVVVLCFLFNSKVIISYMHFEYYLLFINVGYLFLNGYSLLSLKK